MPAPATATKAKSVADIDAGTIPGPAMTPETFRKIATFDYRSAKAAMDGVLARQNSVNKEMARSASLLEVLFRGMPGGSLFCSMAGMPVQTKND